MLGRIRREEDLSGGFDGFFQGTTTKWDGAVSGSEPSAGLR
jgi:hypothetical protein